MIRLGVNIDHVATLRNARGEIYPDPCRAALMAKNSGANSITIHLREDRRHITDKDLFKIIRIKKNSSKFRNGSNKRNVENCLKIKTKFCLYSS